MHSRKRRLFLIKVSNSRRPQTALSWNLPVSLSRLPPLLAKLGRRQPSALLLRIIQDGVVQDVYARCYQRLHPPRK
ncbi:hypothetical protein CYMTET_8553 [Cymbomonas tetramitiformis]|uniref:Uncharacterized protein n=1 Tax=Cymbomonas tetramitiformis TaxID=36881 RepID=A0AAE0GTA0_9CHLO|nr:hypothetical protein CYMTET_8553 [Cymbomonas tetramitiformis]